MTCWRPGLLRTKTMMKAPGPYAGYAQMLLMLACHLLLLFFH